MAAQDRKITEFTDLGAMAEGDILVAVRGGETVQVDVPALVAAFTDLSDTPGALTGQGGRFVAVNAAGDALEFVAAPQPGSSGVTTFLALTGTPSAWGTAGQLLQVNEDADGLEFVDAPAGTFAGLTDGPGALGTGGQLVAMNPGGTALQFIDSGVGPTFTEVLNANLTATFDPVQGFLWADTTYDLPADGYLMFTGEDGGYLLHHTVRVGDIRALAAATVGQVPDLVNATDFIALNLGAAAGQAGAVVDLAVFVGRSATNDLLFTVNSPVLNNPMPLRILRFKEDTPPGPSNFLGLTDTPAAFGTTGQVPVVNADGDGLEFADQSGGGASPITELFNGNLDIGATAILAGNVTIPESGFILGTANLGDTSGGIHTFMFNVAALTPLTAGVVGSNLGTLNRGIRIPVGIRADLTQEGLIFGKTASGALLIQGLFGTGTPDPMPLRLLHLTPGASGGGGGGGGATTFTALTDTPSALGTAGQVPVVNPDADALIWASLRNPRDPQANDYLHLGTGTYDPDNQTEGSGIRTGLVAAQRGLLEIGATRRRSDDLRFDNTLANASTPTGGSYDPATGQIVLPAGHWIVCATIKVRHISGASGGAGGARVWATLEMKYGGTIRHAQRTYIRYAGDANQTNGITEAEEAEVTVAGAVVSDGVQATTLAVSCAAQPNNSMIRYEGAHVHAYRQVV